MSTSVRRVVPIARGALDERDNVCPRCNRELYAFRTPTGPIFRCRGWDLIGTPCTLIKACQDEAVKFKDKNTNRTEDGDWAIGSGGPCAGPHTGWETSTLPEQDGGSQNPTLSNDWAAQMQVLMSDPELAQEHFALWQLIPSISATARSVIQPGVVADVPSPQRERQVHWGPVELDTRMD